MPLHTKMFIVGQIIVATTSIAYHSLPLGYSYQFHVSGSEYNNSQSSAVSGEKMREIHRACFVRKIGNVWLWCASVFSL